MTAPVTIVSCVYGDRGHERFIPEWADSLGQLNTQPKEIIVATDRKLPAVPGRALVSKCKWKHPQAYYMQQAITAAKTEWVWILDVDDTAIPDALDGIENVTADVWQMGYLRSDGVTYISPQLTAAEYLLREGNCFTGASAIRTDAFRAAGGFPDIAFQDWGLWRRLARNGATFEASSRAHYRYSLHNDSRTRVEFVAEHLDEYHAELFADG